MCKRQIPLRPLKRGACGRTYTPDQWRALPLKDFWGDRLETLEFRNCVCGSTIAQPVERDDDESQQSNAAVALSTELPFPRSRVAERESRS